MTLLTAELKEFNPEYEAAQNPWHSYYDELKNILETFNAFDESAWIDCNTRGGHALSYPKSISEQDDAALTDYMHRWMASHENLSKLDINIGATVDFNNVLFDNLAPHILFTIQENITVMLNVIAQAGDIERANSINTLGLVPLKYAFNKPVITKDPFGTSAHRSIAYTIQVLARSTLFLSSTKDISIADYNAGISGGHYDALIGVKYILAKWILVTGVHNDWLLSQIAGGVPVSMIAKQYPLQFLKAFITELPTRELLNKSRKWLITRYASCLMKMFEIDVRSRVKSTGPKTTAGLLVLLFRIATHERDLRDLLVKHISSTHYYLGRLCIGGVSSLRSNVQNTNMYGTSTILHRYTQKFSRMIMDPSITRALINDSPYVLASRITHDNILRYFENNNIECPYWMFINVLSAVSRIRATRHIYQETLRENDTALIARTEHLVSLQKMGITPTMTVDYKAQADLGIETETNILIRDKVAAAPDTLPETMEVIQFVDRKKLHLPFLFAMDENQMPSILIPSLPKTTSFLLEAYGISPNDPLAVYGGISDTFLNMSVLSAQTSFAKLMTGIFYAERYTSEGFYLIGPKHVDIARYFGDTDPDRETPEEDIFLKYNLISSGNKSVFRRFYKNREEDTNA